MTYNEVVDALEQKATDLGLPFYHNTQDHVNEYQGTFPVVVLDPMPASLEWPNTNVMAAVAKYEIALVFMDLIDPSSDRAEKQAVVAAQTQNAYNFARQMADDAASIPAIMHSIVANVRVGAYFTFNWNAHLTSGATLTFTWETEPTWDCDSLTPALGTRGNPYELTFSAVAPSSSGNVTFTSQAAGTATLQSTFVFSEQGKSLPIAFLAGLVIPGPYAYDPASNTPFSRAVLFPVPTDGEGNAVYFRITIEVTAPLSPLVADLEISELSGIFTFDTSGSNIPGTADGYTYTLKRADGTTIATIGGASSGAGAVSGEPAYVSGTYAEPIIHGAAFTAATGYWAAATVELVITDSLAGNSNTATDYFQYQAVEAVMTVDFSDSAAVIFNARESLTNGQKTGDVAGIHTWTFQARDNTGAWQGAEVQISGDPLDALSTSDVSALEAAFGITIFQADSGYGWIRFGFPTTGSGQTAYDLAVKEHTYDNAGMSNTNTSPVMAFSHSSYIGSRALTNTTISTTPAQWGIKGFKTLSAALATDAASMAKLFRILSGRYEMPTAAAQLPTGEDWEIYEVTLADGTVLTTASPLLPATISQSAGIAVSFCSAMNSVTGHNISLQTAHAARLTAEGITYPAVAHPATPNVSFFPRNTIPGLIKIRMVSDSSYNAEFEFLTMPFYARGAILP